MSGQRKSGRPMSRLLRLYPRRWRERYGPELSELCASLAAEQSRGQRGRGLRGRLWRLWLEVDLARGAVDAHLQRRFDMIPSVRGGIRGGLLLGAVAAVVAVLTVVVFPPGPDESDDDPEYLIQIGAAYLLIAVAFAVIGARARRRSASPWAGVQAGAAAALVLAISVTVVYATVNNVFFSIVSQQHDKRVAFAASGWSSMRAFINMQLLLGILFVLPAATLIGGALGGLGGVLAPGRWRRPSG